MKTALSAAEWSLVAELQNLQRKFPPGSLTHDKYEHAVDLILTRDRILDVFFRRNLLRDSLRTVARRHLKNRFVDIEEALAEPLGTSVSAEDTIIGFESLSLVKAKINALDAKAKSCFRHMIEEKTLLEFSVSERISPSTAKALRKQIRNVASLVFSGQLAA